MNKTISSITAAAMLILGACTEHKEEAASTTDGESARTTVKRAAIDVQEVKAPCDWLTREEIVQTIGPLAGEPYRVLTAESVRANDGGAACAYPVATDRGVADVALQVDLEGAPELESAEATMVGVVATEMSQGEAHPEKKRIDGWDAAGWFAGERLYRMGHVAIRIGDRASVTKEASLDRIAQLLREKMADKPFANSLNDANVAGSTPDPCELITRAEAEAVLGPLAVTPYRSLKSSALAHGDGWSCTYYSPGHRAFVVQPAYYDGKESFQMAAGLGSLFRSNLGGADEGDLLDGPWDSATQTPGGKVSFLKGETLLTITYQTSAADIEGAAKLAAIAMPRAVKIASTP